MADKESKEFSPVVGLLFLLDYQYMFKHVSFLTLDLTATLAFYEKLGGSIEKDIITGEGHRRGIIRLGEGQLQFFQIPGQWPNPHACWAEHIAIYVQNLPELLPKLAAEGVSVPRALQVSPTGRAMAFVLDPDGRQIELLDQGKWGMAKGRWHGTKDGGRQEPQGH